MVESYLLQLLLIMCDFYCARFYALLYLPLIIVSIHSEVIQASVKQTSYLAK